MSGRGGSGSFGSEGSKKRSDDVKRNYGGCLLQTRQLPVGGRKDDLVARLVGDGGAGGGRS